jgi:hypothetical protein
MVRKVDSKVAAVIIALTGSLLAAAQPAWGGGSGSGAIPVSVVEREEGYVLLRGGQPYRIRGAGLETGNMERLAAHGGNSFRNWRDRFDGDGLRTLDEAAKYGLTVAMCLPIGRERHGFDYDDEEAVARQFEAARRDVLRFKDHPALLLWIIGNEPDLKFSNPKVFDAINDISKMIHEIDGNHPTTTALSFSFSEELAGLIRQRAPDLDIISVQKYADIVNVPKYIDASGIDRPFMITEWGPAGHWEVNKTSWGAPIEENSSEKADRYLRNYRSTIEPSYGRVIGSYVFKWGQKQERTPTWYSMFLEDGTETEVIDVMHSVWTGAPPNNRAPRIEALSLDSRTADQNVTLKAGGAYPAAVTAHDPDGDALDYRWVLMRESRATQEGGDREQVPDILNGLIADNGNGRVNVTAPGEAGAYRLFVYVHDGQGHAGHANLPFLVE